MANLFDYLTWRGDITFDMSPVNEVDCLLFSWLSYVDFDGIVPAEFNRGVSLKKTSGLFLEKFNLDKILAESLSFTRTSGLALKKCAETDRFAKIRFSGYRNVIDYSNDSQFSAITIQIDPRTAVVVFRGTDDTIVGWKEDFNMCFMPQVPAQKKALEYLEEAASKIRGQLYVCGHSKGGNLAIYSACLAKKRIRDRIIKVYNYDDPGFGDETVLGEDAAEVLAKTESYTPSESIVGMLLNHVSNYTVIRSTQRSVMQHDAASWMIQGKHFITADEVEEASKVFDETMKNWLKQMSDDERASFIDALFRILSANEAKTTGDISSDVLKSGLGMLKEYNNLSKESRAMLKKFTGVFLKEGTESIIKRRKEAKSKNALNAPEEDKSL
ncbi:MAG: DUF2974 domain-containing protein [Lachnospiraceae bacterium]|nr:DUF2974 domain-containing protein [Lachnospiraceae bacterium]